MSNANRVSNSVLADLRIEDEDGDYYAAVGLTISLMYAQRMEVMVPAFRAMLDVYDAYLSPVTLNTKRVDDWSDYTPKQLSRLLNRFSAPARRGEEMVLAHFKDDGPFQYFGEYGVRIKGVSANRDTPFRDTNVCAAYFELSVHEVERAGRSKILQLVRDLAEIAPFQHGMCGYGFKYFHRAGDTKIHLWMGDKALRYSAVHPFMNKYEHYCRHHIPNVNWVTLLGRELIDKLGGPSAISGAALAGVDVEVLPHGVMLVAGDRPPLGDRNTGAADLGPLREVSRLTRPILLDRDTYCNDILNYLFEDDRKERSERWLNRFNWQPGQP